MLDYLWHIVPVAVAWIVV